MDSRTRLLELISLVYDTVEQQSAWHEFLDRFADAVGGEATSLLLYSPESRIGDVPAGTRLAAEARRRYTEYYVTTDTWGIYGGHMLTPGKVFSGVELCPEHLLQTSEFYADFCRPNDIHHQFCGVIAKRGEHISLLSSTRPRRADAFDRHAHDLLGLLIPHLQQAAALHHRLGTIAAENRWRAEMLDRLAFGVILVSAQGRVLRMNACALALLNRKDGLSNDKGGLQAAASADTRQLQALLKSAVDASLANGWGAGGTMTVNRPSGRRPLRLLISPHRSIHREPDEEQAAASVFLFDPESELDESAVKLSRVYSFTPGEARVAAMLMLGLDVGEVAKRLGITRSTTRNVLKRLFMKTNTNRQAELVRELLVGPTQVLGA